MNKALCFELVCPKKLLKNIRSDRVIKLSSSPREINRYSSKPIFYKIFQDRNWGYLSSHRIFRINYLSNYFPVLSLEDLYSKDFQSLEYHKKGIFLKHLIKKTPFILVHETNCKILKQIPFYIILEHLAQWINTSTSNLRKCLKNAIFKYVVLDNPTSSQIEQIIKEKISF